MSAHASSAATAPRRPRLWHTADELRAAWSNGELLEVAPFVPRPERIHRLDLGQTGRGDTHLSTLIRHWFQHRLDEASRDRLAFLSGNEEAGLRLRLLRLGMSHTLRRRAAGWHQRAH